MAPTEHERRVIRRLKEISEKCRKEGRDPTTKMIRVLRQAGSNVPEPVLREFAFLSWSSGYYDCEYDLDNDA